MTTTSPTSLTNPRDLPEGPRFFNRDLSWLEFNRRVLAQAADEAMPLLERLRFLAIFTSNLDEFFMKRVGLVKRQIHAGVDTPSPEGLTPRQQLSAIREAVTALTDQQAAIYKDSMLPGLARADIQIVQYTDLTPRDRAWVDDWYRLNVFPALTPLAVDPTHRFPFISNLSDNLAILARAPRVAGEQPPPPRRPANGARAVDSPSDNLFARLKFPPIIQHF